MKKKSYDLIDIEAEYDCEGGEGSSAMKLCLTLMIRIGNLFENSENNIHSGLYDSLFIQPFFTFCGALEFNVDTTLCVYLLENDNFCLIVE